MIFNFSRFECYFYFSKLYLETHKKGTILLESHHYHQINKRFNPDFRGVLFCLNKFRFLNLTQSTCIFQGADNATESSIINNDDVWQPRMREVSMKLIKKQGTTEFFLNNFKVTGNKVKHSFEYETQT